MNSSFLSHPNIKRVDGRQRAVFIGGSADSFLGVEAETVLVSELSSLIEAAGEEKLFIKFSLPANEDELRQTCSLFLNRKDVLVCDINDDVDISLGILTETVFPVAELLLIGVKTLGKLFGKEVKSYDEIASIARKLLGVGAKSLLVTGTDGGTLSQDYFCGRDGKSFWITTNSLEAERIKGEKSLLSSALVSALSIGLDIYDSLVLSKAVLQNTTRNSANSLPKPSIELKADDFPWINKNVSDGRLLFAFPKTDCSAPELYPIVDSSQWVKRLLGTGVKTIQLRIKNLQGAELENEIKTSISVARGHNAKLFINDFWELAIKHDAYGVHLGQDDILSADMRAIEKAGLRLGLSSHCYYEGAIAHGFRPSYIAFGPLYHTALKAMDFAPQGIENLKLWQSLFDCPVVAIGGIMLDLADEVMQGKPDFISVVRDITLAKDPEARAAEWFKKLGGD